MLQAAFAIRSSMKVIEMFAADLTPAEYLHRPVPKANCVAWTLGHLVMATRMMSAAFGVSDLPALPEGFEKRYSQKEGAPEASDYGETSVLIPLLSAHMELFAKAVELSSAEKLAGALPSPHPMFGTLEELAAFAPLHTAIHAGQISTIRRSLGRPPMF